MAVFVNKKVDFTPNDIILTPDLLKLVFGGCNARSS